jgi:hypothetical protein
VASLLGGEERGGNEVCLRYGGLFIGGGEGQWGGDP